MRQPCSVSATTFRDPAQRPPKLKQDCAKARPRGPLRRGAGAATGLLTRRRAGRACHGRGVVRGRRAVATITLQRPAAMNSMSMAAKIELLDAVSRAAEDPAVRAVVLTGAGDRAFCAGQDLRDLEPVNGAPPDLGQTVLDHYNPIVMGLATMPKPVIAGINGVAAGAGAAFALACDMRFAARSASFLMAFANIGLTGDSGISWTLQRIVGHARALTMMMLPERLDAERALELGMVNAVVPGRGAAGGGPRTRRPDGPRSDAGVRRHQAGGAACGAQPTSAPRSPWKRSCSANSASARTTRGRSSRFIAKEPAVFNGR